MKENEDLKVERAGNYLEGKSIALCISGGIAAIETPKIARHLRRYGADVTAYLTSSATKFIGETSLEWATGKETVSKLSGLAEHIALHDLVLVCPATMNTVNKIFAGIADNPVTTLVASALGAYTPVYLAPTMHDSLYYNPIFQDNLAKIADPEKAEEYGIKIIEPRESEGKRKIPKLENIVAEVCRGLSSHPIKGKKVLITGGPTPVKIDGVRRITNVFKGTLAREIAKEAYHRGADVKLLLGKTGIKIPSYLDVTYHDDLEEYIDNVFRELRTTRYDSGIFSAAVADYQPIHVVEGKIPSQGMLKEIRLKETMKVIKKVREAFPELHMTTFKYEDGISKEQLFGIARDRIRQGYQLVVANRKQDMTAGHNAYVFDRFNMMPEEAYQKQGIASKLMDKLGFELTTEEIK
jgi:phosphopantothenoylcysteine decarboxylase/phosphopantothenate--cysteine ligase